MTTDPPPSGAALRRGLPQAELVRLAQQGDRSALAALLSTHQEAALRFGMRLCSSQADAQDAAQEALLLAIEKLPEFRGESSFSSWLYAIVRSRCSRRARTTNRLETLDEDSPLEGGTPPDEAFSAHQLHAIVERALDTLDPMYREVVVLRDIEGVDNAEAAEITGQTVAAVKSRLHRGRAMLKAEVERLLESRAETGPRTCAELAAWVRERASQKLSSERCAELEAHLSRCADDSAEAAELQRVLISCAMLRASRVPTSVMTTVQVAIDRWLGNLS